MTTENGVPTSSYGILEKTVCETVLDEAAEQVKNLGYAILDSGYSVEEKERISSVFNVTREQYCAQYGSDYLKKTNEHHTIRLLLAQDDSETFQKMAFNKNLIGVLKKLIQGKFILNQQNGIINPPQENYNQGLWHRDLPYQHFTSSKPIAINALYCIDDFTDINGATFVLPASHKLESFPSFNYIHRNAIQARAKAGSFILLDCMVFHSGGFNKSNAARRAVNHVYNIPYFKQQINIPLHLKNRNLTIEQKEMLGFSFMEPCSVDEYLSNRMGKEY